MSAFASALRQPLQTPLSSSRTPGRVSGKSVKTIRGTDDTFHRLRTGDYRVMHVVFDSDRVILVLGIVDRADLERWLRSR